MNLPAKELLRRLGAGESIPSVCQAAGLARPEFDAWWQEETSRRVPPMTGTTTAGVRRAVRIERDRWGIPSIFAEGDEDLFFGFGYAMAQDRLFQLDYLRRRGAGQLAEVLGPDGKELELLGRVAGFQSVLELDRLARTVGIRRIAAFELEVLPAETRRLLEAFSAGVNAVIEESRDRLPIEFDLLDYRPEPWTPLDCLTVEGEFRWYLTGRFPVIVLPELARRALGEGPLYEAFLEVESDAVSILRPGEYPTSAAGTQPVGRAAGDPDEGAGSNNWVLAGGRSATGKPMLGSDPHIAFDAVSCWYEVHLCGGSFHVAGMSYVGMPAVMFGRNPRVAWGCTNNICSQRDLYQEKIDPQHPGCFLFDGKWEPARELEEVIAVKGGDPVRLTVRFSRNGPIVDDVLPPVARDTGPVSLKWLGAYRGGWLSSLLAMNRAGSAKELHEALRPWHVPTFGVVFADTEGHIGYHAVGAVPVRGVAERGYRPGWDRAHQWQGLIPFEGMPQVIDPPRGWVATANNRPAPEDFPYPLSGTWSHGLRAERIHRMIEGKPVMHLADHVAMQHDTLSPRALRCVPPVVRILEGSGQAWAGEVVAALKAWDCRMSPDSVAASVFEVFFALWMRTVAEERFEPGLAPFLAEGLMGPAAALLVEDRAGWFHRRAREQAVAETMDKALVWLRERLGPEMKAWTWDQLHVLRLRHVLSGRGDLAELLDHGGLPAPGDAVTVCSTTSDGEFRVRMGGGYRMVADLATDPPQLRAIDAQGQSGHPASAHYADGLDPWLAGEYHALVLDAGEASRLAVQRLMLQPAAG
jgi:penicillin amidase